jgi:hypothetical protein
MNPLTKFAHTHSKPLVKDTVEPRLTIDVSECRPELFAAFSKFHLNTSKSTFMKVVQLVEGHNFHVDWYFKF